MSIFTDPEVIVEAVKLRKSRNFAKDIVWNGCARPWYVYVETFEIAFLKLFITLLLFQIDDVIRYYGQELAKTRGSGKRRHGIRGPRTRLDVRATPQQKFFRQGLVTVIKITAPLEAIGFGFLLISATDRFFGDWQTLIESSPFCTNPISTGPFSRTDPNSILTIREAGQGFGYATLEQNRGGWGNTALSVNPTSGPLFIVATIKGRAGPAGIAKAALQLRVQIDGKTTLFKGEDITAEPEATVTFIVTARKFLRLGSLTNINWEMVGQTQLSAVREAEGDVFATIEPSNFNI